ncbi:MAG TPA: GNAT family N-acetyltransferase [Polyangiaceae bacterium]|nr:GNAT family N-acetyltransferase [Polyangiaceae bacterium]
MQRGRDRSDQRAPLVVEEIEQFDAFSPFTRAWRDLQRSAGRLPFTSYEWNAAWFRHLSRQHFGVGDRAMVKAIWNQDGALVAVAPLMLTEVPSRGPLRLRCLQFFGADPNLTEVRGMLTNPGYEVAAYGALLDHLGARNAEWDWVVLPGVPSDEAIEALVSRWPGAELRNPLRQCVLELPTTWSAFKTTRSRNIKESLRKCENSLARDGLEAVFRVAEPGRAFTTALDHFFRLHRARALREDTSRHADFFVKQNAKRFLSALGNGSSIRVFTMEVGRKTVAARLGFVENDALYLYYSGYDPAFARYSVMTHLVAEAIKYAIARGLRSVNLSTGIDVSKTRWSPWIVETKTFALPSQRARARATMRAYDDVRRLLKAPLALFESLRK